MGTTNGHDDRLRSYYHAEGSSGIGGGASIEQTGVSEKTLVLFVLVPVTLALVAAIGAAGYAGYAGGTAIAKADAALELAQIAERNAKLAQYQLEEAIEQLGIDAPNQLPEDEQ